MSPIPDTDDNVVKFIIKSIVTRVHALNVQKTNNAITCKQEPSIPVPPSAFAVSLPSEVGNAADIGRRNNLSAKYSSATSNNLIITDTLAAFVVRAIILNPDNSFPLDTIFSKVDVDRLIEASTLFIGNHGHPETETVKMQVYFDSTFPQQSEYLHREKQTQKNATNSLFREIADYNMSSMKPRQNTTAVVNPKELDGLYTKIVGYILLHLAMGDPTDIQVTRETYVALESVFPNKEALAFLNLSRSDKEKQLHGLSQLVAGIRLFNRHVNKSCKDKIENVPELCAREIKEAFDLIKTTSTAVECKIRQLSALLSHQFMEAIPSLQLFSTEISQNLSQCQTFYRQILIYLDTIRDQIKSSSLILKSLDERMTTNLSELAHSCRAKSTVLVDQVYPKFMELAVIWQAFQDELFLDAFRRGVLDTLVAFEQCVSNASIKCVLSPDTWTAVRTALELGESKGLTDELLALLSLAPEHVHLAADSAPIEPIQDKEDQIVHAAALLEIDLNYQMKSRRNEPVPQRGVIEILHPGNTAQYYKLPVEFGGFCPVTLCTGLCQGIVTPGNWNFGIIKYLDKLYTFRGPDEAKRFANNPDVILLKVLEVARQRMGLVQLLQLYGYFPSIRALENEEVMTQQALLGQRPLVCEVGSQVDTHLVDKWIDPKYEWNEWTMRRKALMLVNIQSKATHGSQTHQSHFRREQDVQVFPTKQNGIQTMCDMGTDPLNLNLLK